METVSDIYGDGKQRILFLTSDPNTKVIILTWNGKSFDEEKVGQIPSLYNFSDGAFNPMVAFSGRTKSGSYLIVSGIVGFYKKQTGWEGTDKGFFVEYKKTGNIWNGEVIDGRSILGADVQK